MLSFAKLLYCGNILRYPALSVVLKTVSIAKINCYIKKKHNQRKQNLRQEQGINTKHVTEIIVNPKNRELFQCLSCL